MKEGHPIYEAIDRGGGQMCDILGVVRELAKAGYVIVPRVPIPKMMAVIPDGRVLVVSFAWAAMIDAALEDQQ